MPCTLDSKDNNQLVLPAYAAALFVQEIQYVPLS